MWSKIKCIRMNWRKKFGWGFSLKQESWSLDRLIQVPDVIVSYLSPFFFLIYPSSRLSELTSKPFLFLLISLRQMAPQPFSLFPLSGLTSLSPLFLNPSVSPGLPLWLMPSIWLIAKHGMRNVLVHLLAFHQRGSGRWHRRAVTSRKSF